MLNLQTVQYDADGVERAKAALAEKLADPKEWSDHLLGHVHNIAKAEVEQRLARLVLKVMDSREIPFLEAVTIVREAEKEEILCGPDDTWSGRGNDLRRVRYQARLDWIRDAKYAYEG